MTTEEAAQQGIYRRIHKGVEVPYPQLHPELAHEEAHKTSDPLSPSKRKAADQPDDEPSSKRPAGQSAATAIPRHIGGLLSAQVPDEPPSQPATPSADSSDDEAAPPPEEPATRGRNGKRTTAAAAAAATAETPDAEADNNPPIPAGAGEPDEYGVRLVTKRARGTDPGTTRIMVPALFEYDPLEIGFRDSTNDSSRNATKAKRKQFLNTPNTQYFHYDRLVASYDMTTYEEGDLDQELIKKHNLHPKYGIFLKDSNNQSEPPRPYVFGRNPIVFVTDKGKVLHTSRSVAATKASDMQKNKLKSAMLAALNEGSIDEEDLHDEEYQSLVNERQARRLKHQEQEDAAQAKDSREIFSFRVNALLAAAATLDHEASAQVQDLKASDKSASPVATRPSTRSRNYDAIRDIIDSSEEPAKASTNAVATRGHDATESTANAASALLLLASVALGDGEASSTTAPAPTSAIESAPKPDSAPDSAPIHVAGPTELLTIQMPEPVHPRQLRDPSELEQHGQLVKFSSDNPFLPEPLAPQLPQFTPREQAYAAQSNQSPLAAPDIFAYREPGYDQQPVQQMQPRQTRPYATTESHYEPPQLRRPSQMSQGDQYAPARPNTEDVAFLDSQALLDPQLLQGGQRRGSSQLQAPQPEQAQKAQSGGVLQQPQNSFFLTALNSPAVSPPQDRPEPLQTQQQFGSSVGASSRPLPANEGSPCRTPFTHPNGAEQPSIRPLLRSSGSLAAPVAQASVPPHMMLNPSENSDSYPQPQPPQLYNQGYQSNGYATTEQGSRLSGYIAQPMMHPSQQPPAAPYSQYASSGPMVSQNPSQYSYAGLPGSADQSPPPFGSEPNGPPSPSLGGVGTPTSSRNKNNQYRPIHPAPCSTEKPDGKGSQDRTFVYHPFQGNEATSVPPSQGPTQIRGWTHNPVPRKTRGKNSTDSQIDPALGQGERK